jgi:hypothetical protein
VRKSPISLLQLSFSISAVAVAALAAAPAAATTTTYDSGQKCFYADGSYALTDQGQENPQDNDDYVYCPVAWTSAAANGQGNAAVSVDAATLIYTDTSSGAFDCDVVTENWDGSIYASYSLYSCPTYGGCGQNGDTSWQGAGQLNWSGDVIPNAPGTLYPTQISISCRIPGSGSVIRGYNISIN